MKHIREFFYAYLKELFLPTYHLKPTPTKEPEDVNPWFLATIIITLSIIAGVSGALLARSFE